MMVPSNGSDRVQAISHHQSSPHLGVYLEIHNRPTPRPDPQIIPNPSSPSTRLNITPPRTSLRNRSHDLQTRLYLVSTPAPRHTQPNRTQRSNQFQRPCERHARLLTCPSPPLFSCTISSSHFAPLIMGVHSGYPPSSVRAHHLDVFKTLPTRSAWP